MLRCAGLYACEVDDLGLALSQIQTQLSEKIELLEHTVGIIMCHTEFVDSGVLKHVAENLPFDVAGITTSAQAVNDMISEMVLTVFVMTSDAILFKVGTAETIEEDIEGSLRAAIEEAAGSATPSLIFAFPPLSLNQAGDDISDAWGKIFPGVPVFGTLAVDDTADFTGGKTIYRGNAAKMGHSFILCYGDINPRFLIATLPESDVQHKGEITKSESNLVYEIDGRSAGEYLTTAGFISKKEPLGIFWFVPFLISQQKREDYDGVPVVRGLASVTEDGTAIFRGKIDEGSIFTLLNMTAQDVVAETKTKLQTTKDMTDINGVIAFSCIVRHMMIINKNPLEEMEQAKETLGDLPFMMGYSGGEYCPTSIRDGGHVNRFHNYSFVALVL